MARTLFFRMVLRKFLEIANKKPIFNQYNIFYNYEYFFFQSAFWSLFNHCQRINQIRKNVVRVIARLVFLFCCTLTTGRCNAFQTPQNHWLNVCLMKILKSIVTKNSVVCFYNSCEENFKSSGLSNISNLNNGCVWNLSKFQRSLFERIARFF